MKNGTTLTFGRGLKICIAINLCCYVALLGFIELTHDHDHCEHAHSEETCTACVYTNLHAGIEIEPFTSVSPFFFSTTLPFYEAVFLPSRLTANTQIRAPPISSNTLTNFAA